MNSKVSAAVAVVIYNISCSDSLTCQSLERMETDDLIVIIHDNSTGDLGNREFCIKRGWSYLGGNGNVGISKAYNACVDYLSNQPDVDLLCLFDDDTQITQSYFEKLFAARKASQDKLFVPLIFSAERLLSPCRLTPSHQVQLFENPQLAKTYRGNDLSAINSGMAIDMHIFDDYRYDENIFLDGVDHHFVQQMYSRGNRICVFDYHCDHQFSGDGKPTVDSAMSRFRIYAKDYRYILQNDKFAYWRLVGKRAVSLCLQYHNLRFLGVLREISLL